ncbi:hypothetical protein CH54_3612 [Yersinia rochesterensis]|uniref:Uncharacterized protein n=1 Tax=Yersinia rochesterensis TaxID=1604335 RepID=A0ABN4FES6_9GAMM|nr:hypothetical protein DJ57_430 [Yersinia rochesterensis]AJI85514.1 hypothetical protein AW19_2174 [Yersinia frederiksenii Y225]AJJ36008.1 hypothetical protein CH54_3612 [Yersinia rochesterensis]CNG90989.1 Uncharacterised protein [Yersinia kristensenii]CRY63554.1 Uncharacterised protein [Yersinia kristensenii]
MLCGLIESSVKVSLNYYRSSFILKFRFLLKLVLLNNKALWSSMFLIMAGVFDFTASLEAFDHTPFDGIFDSDFCFLYQFDTRNFY